MENQLSKNLVCIVMRGGIEIWTEKERVESLILGLKNLERSFVKIDEQIINSVDIVGIFTPATMEEITRRKNGEWKCKFNNWHDRFIKCECKYQNLDGEALAKLSRGF